MQTFYAYFICIRFMQHIYFLFFEYPLKSMVRRKLDTLEEAGLGNSASHVTTVDHTTAADQDADDDWDDDEFFLDCISQDPESSKPSEPENPPEPENIKKLTLEHEKLKKVKSEKTNIPGAKKSAKPTKSESSKRKSSSSTENLKKRSKSSAADILDELSDNGGFRF